MAPKWKSPVVPSDASTPQRVKVPCSGWYGACFSSEECDCVYAVQDASNVDSVLLSLPQRLGKDAVSSLEIGTLVYLEESSNVTVSRTSACDLHAGHVPSFEWCLVLQYEGGRDNYKPKKSLVCAECCRMFSSMKAIQSHIDSMHRVVDPNSIWSKPLKVVYQDKSVVIIDKPQGMAVMGESPSLFRSGLLMALAGDSDDATKKPVHVHRLDAPTGGLLVLARTRAAEVQLKSCFASRVCRKRYLALAIGRIEPKEGTIEEAISGKPAVTHYKVVQYSRCVDDIAGDGWVTLVDLHPITGRQHQLRRHLKHIGHPIWGDKKYAPYRKRKSPGNDGKIDRADLVHSTRVEQDPHCRLCLWAMEISFPHPETSDSLTVSLNDKPEWLTSLLAYQEDLVDKAQGQS